MCGAGYYLVRVRHKAELRRILIGHWTPGEEEILCRTEMHAMTQVLGEDSTCEKCDVGHFTAESSRFPQCTPCGPGTYSKNPGSNQCQPCSPSAFQEHPGQANCTLCPRNSFRLGGDGTSVDQCHCVQGFYESSDGNSPKKCKICPAGAWCAGSINGTAILPVPLDGYWGDPHFPTRFFECLGKRCNRGCIESYGGELIGEGEKRSSEFCSREEFFACSTEYDGRMCASCSDDYFYIGNIWCAQCPEGELSKFFMTICGGLAVVCCWIALESFSTSVYDALDVLLLYLQISALIQRYSIRWPAALELVSSVLFIVNFDVDCISPLCVLRGYTFVYQFPLQLLMPVMWLLPYLAHFLFTYIRHHFFLHDRIELVDRSFDSMVKNMLGFLIIVYHSLCNKCLEAFMCRELANGEYFLQVDPSILCWQGYHVNLVVAASFGILIYVIGIPVLIIWILLAGGRDNLLATPVYLRRYGFLYRRYRPEYYWWELMLLARRFVCCSVAVLLQGYYIQPSTGLLMLILALCGQTFSQPFKVGATSSAPPERGALPPGQSPGTPSTALLARRWNSIIPRFQFAVLPLAPRRSPWDFLSFRRPLRKVPPPPGCACARGAASVRHSASPPGSLAWKPAETATWRGADGCVVGGARQVTYLNMLDTGCLVSLNLQNLAGILFFNEGFGGRDFVTVMFLLILFATIVPGVTITAIDIHLGRRRVLALEHLRMRLAVDLESHFPRFISLYDNILRSDKYRSLGATSMDALPAMVADLMPDTSAEMHKEMAAQLQQRCAALTLSERWLAAAAVRDWHKAAGSGKHRKSVQWWLGRTLSSIRKTGNDQMPPSLLPAGSVEPIVRALRTRLNTGLDFMMDRVRGSTDRGRPPKDAPQMAYDSPPVTPRAKKMSLFNRKSLLNFKMGGDAAAMVPMEDVVVAVALEKQRSQLQQYIKMVLLPRIDRHLYHNGTDELIHLHLLTHNVTLHSALSVQLFSICHMMYFSSPMSTRRRSLHDILPPTSLDSSEHGNAGSDSGDALGLPDAALEEEELDQRPVKMMHIRSLLLDLPQHHGIEAQSEAPEDHRPNSPPGHIASCLGRALNTLQAMAVASADQKHPECDCLRCRSSSAPSHSIVRAPLVSSQMQKVRRPGFVHSAHAPELEDDAPTNSATDGRREPRRRGLAHLGLGSPLWDWLARHRKRKESRQVLQQVASQMMQLNSRQKTLQQHELKHRRVDVKELHQTLLSYPLFYWSLWEKDPQLIIAFSRLDEWVAPYVCDNSEVSFYNRNTNAIFFRRLGNAFPSIIDWLAEAPQEDVDSMASLLRKLQRCENRVGERGLCARYIEQEDLAPMMYWLLGASKDQRINFSTVMRNVNQATINKGNWIYKSIIANVRRQSWVRLSHAARTQNDAKASPEKAVRSAETTSTMKRVDCTGGAAGPAPLNTHQVGEEDEGGWMKKRCQSEVYGGLVSPGSHQASVLHEEDSWTQARWSKTDVQSALIAAHPSSHNIFDAKLENEPEEEFAVDPSVYESAERDEQEQGGSVQPSNGIDLDRQWNRMSLTRIFGQFQPVKKAACIDVGGAGTCDSGTDEDHRDDWCRDQGSSASEQCVEGRDNLEREDVGNSVNCLSGSEDGSPEDAGHAANSLSLPMQSMMSVSEECL
ncbi:hypothetical protein CYMTET_13415 [Cymbomonas tetramitiformis]|uniref:Tyrosine-protein kinase ephrin type A/B receptor-like domain-containing protein n=1 Tax=Cymbomonas tetramitiformis TaxID=36881 RepID=A0AAE0GIF7_9CHLO|nr:hypothetical protein CYMTET_13415 [Cymbomonas tetramitiformis]